MFKLHYFLSEVVATVIFLPKTFIWR